MISCKRFLKKDLLRIDQTFYKITHNSMKNMGSTPILTNLVGVYQIKEHPHKI